MSPRLLRSGALVASVLTVVLAGPGFAGSKPAKSQVNAVDTACDDPPCNKQELQHAEKKLIKRLQRANQLAVEADYRGEKENAARLHRVFARNQERRLAVTAAIATASD